MTYVVPVPEGVADETAVHCSDGHRRPVEDGAVSFEVEGPAEALAETWDVAVEETDDETEVEGTCTAIKDDGEVCGRDLPCQYHDNE